MRPWILAALGLASCGDVPIAPGSGRVAIWGDRVIVGEESWDFDRLVLRAGARITAQEAYLRVRATELVIEGPVTIDARGSPGGPLDDAVWTSSGGALDDCSIAHRDWALAVSDYRQVPSEWRSRGRAGRDAVGVTLIARRVVGQPSDLHVDVRGGEGGPGRVFVCGCRDHASERFQAEAGPPGADGRWTFVQE